MAERTVDKPRTCGECGLLLVNATADQLKEHLLVAHHYRKLFCFGRPRGFHGNKRGANRGNKI